jgi:transcription elongation factor Elf1
MKARRKRRRRKRVGQRRRMRSKWFSCLRCALRYVGV